MIQSSSISSKVTCFTLTINQLFNQHKIITLWWSKLSHKFDDIRSTSKSSEKKWWQIFHEFFFPYTSIFSPLYLLSTNKLSHKNIHFDLMAPHKKALYWLNCEHPKTVFFFSQYDVMKITFRHAIVVNILVCSLTHFFFVPLYFSLRYDKRNLSLLYPLEIFQEIESFMLPKIHISIQVISLLTWIPVFFRHFLNSSKIS